MIKEDINRSGNRIKITIPLIIYRFGNFIFYSNMPKFPKKIILAFLKLIKLLIIEMPFGLELSFSTKIGAGLRLIHLNGIVINKHAVIGNNCTIFHQVTIGQVDKTGYPTIGDNVYIGAGAKILGNITIGNNVKIGANSVITKNIPSNCTVVGANRILESKKELC